MKSIKSKIKKLEKEMQKERQTYVNLIKTENTKSNPDRVKIRDLESEMYSVVDEIYISEINVLKTDYYNMLINKYNLYLPFEYGDSKFVEQSGYGIFFTNLGFLECKKIIDNEKELKMKRISTYTGIIGALIGLVSVIKLFFWTGSYIGVFT